MLTARFFMNCCLATTMLATAPALATEAKRPDKVSVYFAAHEDDWQLFMNPSAFQDVIKGAAMRGWALVGAAANNSTTWRARMVPSRPSASWPMPTTRPAKRRRVK
jgi:hypothetical protein